MNFNTRKTTFRKRLPLNLDELVVACVDLSDADTLALLLDYRDAESVAETLARRAPAEEHGA